MPDAILTSSQIGCVAGGWEHRRHAVRPRGRWRGATGRYLPAGFVRLPRPRVVWLPDLEGAGEVLACIGHRPSPSFGCVCAGRFNALPRRSLAGQCPPSLSP